MYGQYLDNIHSAAINKLSNSKCLNLSLKTLLASGYGTGISVPVKT